MKKTRTVVAAVLGLSAAGVQAEIITAKYTSSLGQSVNVTRGGNTSNVSTVKFNWQRTDSPGVGIDSSIAPLFNTYCVELTQTISGNTPHTFTVLDPIAAGFSPRQRTLFSRLWASFFPGVDTATESAALQLAIWEVVYDSNESVLSGTFKANSPAPTVALAESYLSAVTAPHYNGPRTSLRVLVSPTVQNQLTAIPAPGASSALLAAALLLVRRRR